MGTSLENLLWQREDGYASPPADFVEVMKEIITVIKTYRGSEIRIDDSIDPTNPAYPIFDEKLPEAEELFIALARAGKNILEFYGVGDVVTFYRKENFLVCEIGNWYNSFELVDGSLVIPTIEYIQYPDLRVLQRQTIAGASNFDLEIAAIVDCLVQSQVPRYIGNGGVFLFLADFAYWGWDAFYSYPDGRGEGDPTFMIVPRNQTSKDFYLKCEYPEPPYITLRLPAFKGNNGITFEITEFTAAKIDIVDADNTDETTGFNGDKIPDKVLLLNFKPEENQQHTITDIVITSLVEKVITKQQGDILLKEVTRVWCPNPVLNLAPTSWTIEEYPLVVAHVTKTKAGKLTFKKINDLSLATGLSFDYPDDLLTSGQLALIFQIPANILETQLNLRVEIFTIGYAIAQGSYQLQLLTR